MFNALDDFASKVYRPVKNTVSSIEQRELLELAILKGDDFEKGLNEHYEKYKQLSLHNHIGEELFTKEYFRDRLNIINQPQEYEKAKNSLDLADKEIKAADELLKKADISEKHKKFINFVREFMYLRTESVDYLALVNSSYKKIFEEIAKMFDLDVLDALNMTYKELIDSINSGKLAIDKSIIKDRAKNGYVYQIAPQGSYLLSSVWWMIIMNYWN